MTGTLPAISSDVLRPESCDGCGLCCEGIGSPVLVYVSRPNVSGPHPFRPRDLPEELIRDIDERFAGLTRGQEPQERCVWFDAAGRRCKHYQWRPQLCRDYELGGSACLSLRRRYLEHRRPENAENLPD